MPLWALLYLASVVAIELTTIRLMRHKGALFIVGELLSILSIVYIFFIYYKLIERPERPESTLAIFLYFIYWEFWANRYNIIKQLDLIEGVESKNRRTILTFSIITAATLLYPFFYLTWTLLGEY